MSRVLMLLVASVFAAAMCAMATPLARAEAAPPARKGETSALKGPSYVDWDTAKKRAAAEKKPIFALFTADWCKPCEDMKRDVFPQHSVMKRLVDFVVAEVDTEHSVSGKALWLETKADGLPVIAFYDATGREIRDVRIQGAVGADKLVPILDDVIERRAGQVEAGDDPAAEQLTDSQKRRAKRPKVRGGEWQTTDTTWLGDAVLITAGSLFGLAALFVLLKVRRERKLRANRAQ